MCNDRQTIEENIQKNIPGHYIKLTHQLSFRNLHLKVEHQTGSKGFIHGPKHHKENQLLPLEHYM